MAEESEKTADGFEWGIVEIFGHRRHAGRVREEERFGTKMLRVDVPVDGDPAKGWTTHFYGGAAIFSFSLADEATVMKANAPYRPYRLSAPKETGGLDPFGRPLDEIGPDENDKDWQGDFSPAEDLAAEGFDP